MRPLPPPIPDDLRHRARPRRRGRRRLATWALLPVLLAPAPLWRVRTVTLDLPAVPAASVAALAALEGSPVMLLDLAWVRRQVESWPGVGEVTVQLDLPGVLRVRAVPAVAVATVATGGGWHGVTAEGGPAGRLPAPLGPVLEGFGSGPAELRRALSTADRLAAALAATPVKVRQVLPDDVEVTLALAGDAPPLVLRVRPAGAGAEARYLELVASGSLAPVGWVDLRRDDRLVVRGGTA